MGKIKRCFLDFESRSQVDIWQSGAAVYAEDLSTEILCLCYAIDNGPVITLTRKTLAAGIKELNLLIRDKAEFHAHNAFFERSIWSNKLTPQYNAWAVPINQWRCTAAKCSAHALPRSLELAAEALNCKNKKDKQGNMTMRYIAKSTGPIEQVKLDRLYAYCRQDVEVEREIDQKLPDLCPKEQKIWFLDQYINSTGVYVDVKTIENAVVCIDQEVETLTKELQTLSGGEINAGTQRDAIKAYLEKKGCKLPDLTKKTVAAALGKVDGNNMRILQLRQQLSLTSNAKYTSLLATVSEDDRVRDILVYHGASTGRWSGKLVQLQNLVKPAPGFDSETPIRILKAGTEAFTAIYGGGVLQTLSSCIRGMLIPTPGFEMFITDFAAIEARVVMWLAEEEKGLKMFAEQDADPSVPDIYVCMARTIYNRKTITKKDKTERQLGKQATLACIAKGSMVYSDKGFIPIETLNRGQKLWDGEQWVNFQELVSVGKKNVIQIGDLWLTPDHRLLTKDGWRLAGEIALSGDIQSLKLGNLSVDGRLLAENITKVLNVVSLSVANAVLKKAEESTHSGGVLPILVGDVARVSKGCLADAPVDTWISLLIHAYENGGAYVSTIFVEDVWARIIKTSNGMALGGFDRPLNRAERSWNTLLRLMGGELGDSLSIELIMPKGTPQEIFDLLHKERTISTKVEECFDIIGTDNSRFQVSNYIAHNCGFGMGVPKFQATCANYNIAVDENLATRAVQAYRTTFKKVVRFWYAMEEAAIRAVSTGKQQQVGKVLWYMDGEFLRMRLPGGRTIVYHRPRVSVENRLSFMAVNPVTKRYAPEDIWGGTMVENCLGKDTKVLTMVGVKNIINVQPGDKVWDGQNWVTTKGCVNHGIKRVGELAGILITPDHKILVGNSWKKAIDLDERDWPAILKPGFLSVISACSKAGSETRARRFADVLAEITSLSAQEALQEGMFLPVEVAAIKPGEKSKKGTLISCLLAWLVFGCTAIQEWYRDVLTLNVRHIKITALAVFRSIYLGFKIAVYFWNTQKPWSCGTKKVWTWIELITLWDISRGTLDYASAKQILATDGLLYEYCTKENNGPLWNFGRRFVLLGKVVILSFTILKKVKPLKKLWRTIKKAVPVYDLLDCGPLNRFTILSTDGPIVVHNCVQAVARDIMAESMLQMTSSGFRILFTVHDELVVEAPTGTKTTEDVLKIVRTVPTWATGCPVNAECDKVERYKK